MGDTNAPTPLVLGRYALYDKIASGGMATVHLGRLLGPVGFARTVAIKRLRAQYVDDAEFVSMFLDEARLVARIRHPNVVPTLDVVETVGELFLVMEYVQGESLARLMRIAVDQGERIPPAMVGTLMAQVLHGLHAAHEARGERGEPLGIVHRDISPQNILIGVDGVARVVDFGVAKATGRIQTTREGQLKGKVAYMPPEQIGGAVDRRTDVYAASAVLWEALAGRKVFTADSEVELVGKIMNSRVGSPAEHSPDVPEALAAIAVRGLSRDPSARFATAHEMAVALEEATPPVASSRISAWVQAAASEALSSRSERVAQMESDSSVDGRPASVDSAMSSARIFPRFATIPMDVTGFANGDTTTQLSSGSVSARTNDKGSRKKRVSVLVGSTVGLLLLVAGGAALFSRPAAVSSASTAVSVPTALPSTTPTPVDSPLPASPEPAVSAPATASVDAPPPAPRQAAAAPSPVRKLAPQRPAAPHPAVTPPVAAASPDCASPYFVDSAGHKQYKPECLR